MTTAPDTSVLDVDTLVNHAIGSSSFVVDATADCGIHDCDNGQTDCDCDCDCSDADCD